MSFRLHSILIFLALMASCSGDPPKQKTMISKAKADSMIIEMEKRYNQMEDDRIRNYIANHAPMEQTSSGYWYLIRKKKSARKTN